MDDIAYTVYYKRKWPLNIAKTSLKSYHSCNLQLRNNNTVIILKKGPLKLLKVLNPVR